MAEVKDELLDHDYDGIREYDNPLPPWWINMFYITIIWAVLYVMYYQVLGIGDRSIDEFQKEMDPTWSRDKDPNYVPPAFASWTLAEGYSAPYYNIKRPVITEKLLAGFNVKNEAPKEVEVVKDYKAFTDAGNLEKGKLVYKANCIPCHGQLGEGGIGPNLTDDYWLHGNKINDVMRTVTKGVPEKGMISWKALGEKNILVVSSYILKLHGTNPPNGKAPQGTLVKE